MMTGSSHPALRVQQFGETFLDTTSDIPCTDHSATQRGFAQTLDVQKPQFMWEQDNFLSAVFGKGNVVDDLFPHMSLKRPASLPIDLTGDEPEEAADPEGAEERPVQGFVHKSHQTKCSRA